MRQRKISAQYILPGDGRCLKRGILTLSESGRIVNLEDTGGKLEEAGGIEFYNGILIPGFVNAHCHLELSHLHGRIPRGTGLGEFIRKVVSERNDNMDTREEKIRKADAMMYHKGIVAVGDVSNTGISFPVKSASKIFYRNFIEVYGPDESIERESLKKAVSLLHSAREKYRLHAGIVPHSAYAVSDRLFNRMNNLAYEDRIYASVHCEESPWEHEMFSVGSGPLAETFHILGLNPESVNRREGSILNYLMDKLSDRKAILLVHNIYSTEKDIIESKSDRENVFRVLCPGSNLYIDGILPPLFLLKVFSHQICLGTDGLCSNEKLDILTEMRFLQEAYPALSLAELSRFACLNGAKALGIEDWAGSFSPGKTPGILLIEMADLQNLRLTGNSKVKVLSYPDLKTVN